MGSISAEAAQIVDEIRKSDQQTVKVAITDVDGVLRGKYIHKKKFLSAVESGFGFCNVVFGWDCADVCYDNIDYTGWHSGYPDAQARIDLNTYRRVPWDNGVPFFLADFEDGAGKPLEVCPRQTLKKIISRTNDAGYSPTFGLEFEWFNFRENPEDLHARDFLNPNPLTPGMFGYSVLRASQNQPYFVALMDELLEFGVPVEGLHTETGPGVFEAAILYDDALVAADRAVLFKAGAKEIAGRFGIIPTFMAKISSALPGCSGHLHQSLWSSDGSTNVFYDANDPNGMSKTFKHYIAGQMHCAPELLPFYAPTINSYKRLVEGMWAPTSVTWGIDNRTASFRVLLGGAKSTRLETRVTGSDINPYLAVAAALASGLYGIENQLELDDPVLGNAYENKDAVQLPRNLYEAAEKMSKSTIARELFGDTFIEHFANTRFWEWRQFQQEVTSWETRRYFEII